MSFIRNVRAYFGARRWARRTLFMVPTSALVLAGSGGSAFAVGESPDPATDITNGAGDTFFTTITQYFTGHVLISVLLLLAVMVGAGVLISWGRKAAKAK
jgi:hypothetical protein